ncbi:MAG: glutaredoxin family protein [Saccharospirillum sp.]|nr:glutaredoxin family protein [Saccharospirillum sp.]
MRYYSVPGSRCLFALNHFIRGLRSSSLHSLVLYHTSGCHLCELAEYVLQEVRAAQPELSWSLVDIASDDTLIERYGWRIPVIHLKGMPSPDLGWPFNAAAVTAFLGNPDSVQE